jgi:hypothetical protein
MLACLRLGGLVEAPGSSAEKAIRHLDKLVGSACDLKRRPPRMPEIQEAV